MRRAACWHFSVSAMLEVDALFVVIIFRDLAGLLEVYVVNAPCLANATVS